MKTTGTKLKSIVVDDSTLQRLCIKKMIDDHPDLEWAGGFDNALKANEFLKEQTISLVFLDVEMPLLNGFDLLHKLEKKPGIIFITGKTDYAFEAFNHEAIDFLQKPVQKERFEKAISKVVSLPRFDNVLHPGIDENNFIFIKSKLKKYKIYVDEMRYIKALGDYIKVVTNQESYTVLGSLKSFEKELPVDKFLRVHKSYIVNLAKVKSYGSKLLQLEKDEIPYSRKNKENLKTALLKLSNAEINTDLY